MRRRAVVRGGAVVVVAATMLVVAAAVASAAGRWTPVNFPTRETADDYAVSCVSASSCYLAGAEGNSDFMHFDGSRLSARPAPPFGPAVDSDLESLACTSARFCIAVGDRKGTPAAADRWNGEAVDRDACPCRRTGQRRARKACALRTDIGRVPVELDVPGRRGVVRDRFASTSRAGSDRGPLGRHALEHYQGPGETRGAVLRGVRVDR